MNQEPRYPTVPQIEPEPERAAQGRPPLNGYVRLVLVLIMVGTVSLFVIARLLNPYDAKGNARRQSTHTQMGLPPCSFEVATGKPCPSCGMTTSFSLLSRGDVSNSMQANSVGTLMAFTVWLMLPWGIACLVKRRVLLFGSIERMITILVLVFFLLAAARWGILIGLPWISS